MACGNIGLSQPKEVLKGGLVSLTMVLHLFQLHSGSPHFPSCPENKLQLANGESNEHCTTNNLLSSSHLCERNKADVAGIEATVKPTTEVQKWLTITAWSNTFLPTPKAPIAPTQQKPQHVL